MTIVAHQADIGAWLREQPNDAYDAVLCDPPYGLGFMGKAWDHGVPGSEVWREILRVCKPGAHLIAFGGTRTFHRLACAIEDAGWEIRDVLSWLYGQGFPKSLDVSKAIDKDAGAEREVVGSKLGRPGSGYGTALKPSWEPAILARKPLDGTVAQNVTRWGVGALAIDACRIGTDGEKLVRPQGQPVNAMGARTPGSGRTEEPAGRWPANLVLDEEAAAALDEQSGIAKAVAPRAGGFRAEGAQKGGVDFKSGSRATYPVVRGDSGGASRFFYVAKVSTAERERGCEHLPNGNKHPTLKPIALATWLARLIMPPRPGRILVPYAGSGSEAIGASIAGWPHVDAVEREAEYVEILRARAARSCPAAIEPANDRDPQLALFGGRR